MATLAEKQLIKKVFLDIAKEQKAYIWEFQKVLLENDTEQVIKLDKENGVEELTNEE